MSEFQELSQAIGVAVHRVVIDEEDLYGITDPDMILAVLINNKHFQKSVKDLINHTTKNT